MTTEKIYKGKYIYLRSVTTSDADFILDIRTDNNKNSFLHATPNDIELQKNWIIKQMDTPDDYYFAMVRCSDDKVVGVISLYDIDRIASEAELGRWVSYGNSLENLESVILLHKFAFEEINVNTVNTFTMTKNTSVCSFWKRFGGTAIENFYHNNLDVMKNSVSADMFFNEICKKFEKFWR